MSNFLAVAAVTASLRRMLQGVVAADVSGSTVTTVRPSGTGAGLPQTGVNAFLYQVLPNPDLRNADLPTRRSDGSVVDRPTAALDLHYLLSFYGDESTLEPQRLLGSVVRTLHARPLLTRQMIRDTVADPGFAFLAGSDLPDQVERVRFSPLGFSLAELSQLWTGPLQKADYVLSLAYGASLVLLTAEEKPTAALPVKERRVFVQPIRQPLIESVDAVATENASDPPLETTGGLTGLLTEDTGDTAAPPPAAPAAPIPPIVLGTTVRLQGQRLLAPVTRVRLAGQVFEPASATDTEVRFILDGSVLDVSSLRAGPQAVQVLQPFFDATPGAANPPAGAESNVVTFVLRPQIDSADLDHPVIVKGKVAGDVLLTVEPPLGAGQRALLLLNSAPGASPAAYTFPVPARTADSTGVRVPVTGVAPGLYLVRFQVDGAESPLSSDSDPSSSTFGRWNGPLVSFGSGVE